jgi:spore germination cell wall hydrolase CwlJ-like protein
MIETIFFCLATAVYFESRGEDPAGQRQVVHVIENRVDHSAWPNDACAVVKQPAAFSFYSDGLPETITDKAAWETAQRAVREAWANPWENLGATHYHATYVAPGWAKRMRRIDQIGNHIFYSEDKR